MKFRLLIASFSCPLLLSGCAVVMAAHQTDDIDIKTLAVGTPRAEVEAVLSNSIEEGAGRVGKSATYQYFTGDEKSYGRATVYGLLDLATLGAAELATTSIEALQGDKHIVKVEYDAHGRLLSLQETVEKAVLEKPEKILGLEKEEPKIQPAALTEPDVAAQPAVTLPAVLTPPQPALPNTKRASM